MGEDMPSIVKDREQYTIFTLDFTFRSVHFRM